MNNGYIASASSPNPMTSKAWGLSTKETKDMDRTYPKQHFESGITSSSQMDIQCAGLSRVTLDEITSGGSTLGGSGLDGSILGGSREIRCESSNTPKIESAPGLQMRSTVYQARHTPAFNIERKLRRRCKARTKKKEAQIKKKEEQLRKAKTELKDE